MKAKLLVLRFVLSLLCLTQLTVIQAQCPATVTATIAAQTNATCPSNGSITIGSNANSVPSATYQAIVAPSGVSQAIQSSNVFTSLPAGNYTFKVVCGASSATVNATITSSYTQITASTAISNFCTSFLPGATVTVSAAGGTTPYNYSIRKTTDPNYSDALSTYGGSNVLNPSDTGVFQVRIKDNCGNFITKTINISPTVPKIYFNEHWFEFYTGCGSTNGLFHFYLTDKNNVGIALSDLQFGLRIDMYEKGVACTRGNFLQAFNLSNTNAQEIVIPNNKDLYFKVTNSCGDTTVTCFNKYSTPGAYAIHWEPVLTGCPTVANPNGLMNIGLDWTENSGPGNEYFALKTLSGTVVRPSTKDSFAFTQLPYGTYIVEAINGCGATASLTIVPPTTGSAPYFADWTSLVYCTTQTGTLTYEAFVRGFVYDLQHANIVITSGPSNVGVSPYFYSPIGTIKWDNMLPGNYTATITSSCDFKTVNFSIANTETTLSQNLNVSTIQACGSANNISAQLNYNGNGSATYELYNSSNVKIGDNVSGIFSNISAGSYTVKARIHIDNWLCGIVEYTIDKPVTVIPAGAAPQVVKKIVMVCEDIAGNPTANGKAIISMNGFGPFKVETKKVTDPDASYVVKLPAATTNFTIDNLVAYQDYRVRITDQCGNTAQTDVSVGILQQFSQSSAVGPCLGQAYTISAPDMIDATYSWTKGGVNVGNTKDLVFANWNTSNNGTYVCTIVIGGGCVTRTYSAQVNSFYCGVLPIKLESFVVTANNCKNILTWRIANQADLAKLQIEKSADGVNFTTLKSFDNTNNTPIANTQFVDAHPAKGNNYYRLLLVEKDGQKLNSPIASVKNNCNGEQANDLIVFPNPISNNVINVFVANTTTGYANIKLINHLGQNVLEQKVKTTENSTTLNLDVQTLANGAYTLIVTNANGNVLQQKVIKL